MIVVKMLLGLPFLLLAIPLELFCIIFNAMFGTDLENRYADWVWDTFFYV